MPMDYKNIPNNDVIKDAFYKAESVINNHQNVLVAISGGSDSDIILDIVEKVRKPSTKVTYVFYHTGLEYEATKKHIKWLEEKYDVKIQRINADVPIPKCAKEYGQPFLSKMVSDRIYRLQRHGFQWEDEPFEELYKKYPKCKSALWWWCGCGTLATSIERNKYLKEFIMSSPPHLKFLTSVVIMQKRNPQNIS